MRGPNPPEFMQFFPIEINIFVELLFSVDGRKYPGLSFFHTFGTFCHQLKKAQQKYQIRGN